MPCLAIVRVVPAQLFLVNIPKERKIRANHPRHHPSRPHSGNTQCPLLIGRPQRRRELLDGVFCAHHLTEDGRVLLADGNRDLLAARASHSVLNNMSHPAAFRFALKKLVEA